MNASVIQLSVYLRNYADNNGKTTRQGTLVHRSSTTGRKLCDTEGRRSSMPKLLHARQPLDETEHRLVRKLATSRHAPADWVWHAKMIARSWGGARTSTSTSAADLGCSIQTVRERLQAFTERGVDGLGLKPGGGRRPRLLEAERSRIIALARSTPPGKLIPERDSGELLAEDEHAAGEWTLDTLTEAARAKGIQ